MFTIRFAQVLHPPEVRSPRTLQPCQCIHSECSTDVIVISVPALFMTSVFIEFFQYFWLMIPLPVLPHFFRPYHHRCSSVRGRYRLWVIMCTPLCVPRQLHPLPGFLRSVMVEPFLQLLDGGMQQVSVHLVSDVTGQFCHLIRVIADRLCGRIGSDGRKHSASSPDFALPDLRSPTFRTEPWCIENGRN